MYQVLYQHIWTAQEEETQETAMATMYRSSPGTVKFNSLPFLFLPSGIVHSWGRLVFKGSLNVRLENTSFPCKKKKIWTKRSSKNQERKTRQFHCCKDLKTSQTNLWAGHEAKNQKAVARKCDTEVFELFSSFDSISPDTKTGHDHMKRTEDRASTDISAASLSTPQIPAK